MNSSCHKILKKNKYMSLLENCKYQLNEKTHFRKVLKEIKKTQQTIPEILYITMIQHFLKNNPLEAIKCFFHGRLSGYIFDRYLYTEILDILSKEENIKCSEIKVILHQYN